MKHGLFLVALVAASLTKAQITITKSNMPAVNDTFRYSTANLLNSPVDLSKTDSNYTWDYTALSPVGQSVTTYESSLLTPYLFYYFNTMGVKIADSLNLGVVTFYKIYEFYKATKSKFVAEGRGYSYSGFPLSADFTDQDEIYQFPLDYGDADTSTFRFELGIPGGQIDLGYNQSGTRINQVDGWGTLKTPFGSFTCLRVKSTIEAIDSVVVSGIGFGVSSTRYEYKWLSDSYKSPVLQVNGTDVFGTFVPSQVTYLDSFRFFYPIADFSATPTSGKPSTVVSFTDKSFNVPTNYVWTITPDSGFTYMSGTTDSSANPVIRFDQLGEYTVKLKVANPQGSNSRTRQQYITIEYPAGLEPTTTSDQPVPLIYPNPSEGPMGVSLPSDWKFPVTMQVIDGAGRLVEQGRWQGLGDATVPHPGAGWYVLKLTDSAGRAFSHPMWCR